MASERGGSGKAVPLLLVLLLLCGAGAWNYRRNLALESQAERPFRSYAEADLERLLAAYEQEAERAQRRAAATRRASVKEMPVGLVGEKAREFERVQRASQRVRDAKGDLAESELMVERIGQELRHRDAERDKVAVFLRRLTTL
jgi:hypothetical protein